MPKTRDSRLFKSVFGLIERSATTLERINSMYQPLRVFRTLGLIVAVVGLISDDPLPLFLSVRQ